MLRSTCRSAAASPLAILFFLATTAALAQPASMVADLESAVAFDQSAWMGPFSEHQSSGGLHYFYQDDGVHGRELWRTDGTALGTFMVRDICPGSCGSPLTLLGAMAALGNELVFAANDGVHGSELWVTDGTALGTRLVADLNAGRASSWVRALASAGSQAFFVAQRNDTETTLWRTDGTSGGTYAITPPGHGAGFSPTSIHPGPGFLYLCNAIWSGKNGLWRSDGTSAGTTFVAPVQCFQNALGKRSQMLVTPLGVLLFQGWEPVATGPSDPELWRSDGSAAGTYRVKDLSPGPDAAQPHNFTWFQEQLVFQTTSGPSTLWRSDGTESGTLPVVLADDARITGSLGTWASGSRYFFAASDPEHGVEPWVFDGVAASRLVDLVPGPGSSLLLDSASFTLSVFETFGDDLIFSASDGVWGTEMWKSDGTAGGTTRLTDIAPGGGSLRFPLFWSIYLSSLDGRPILVEHQPLTGFRMWRLDDSGSAFELVSSLNDQASTFRTTGSGPGWFEAARGRICFESVGDILFFEHQREASVQLEPLFEVNLYRSDGTTPGTQELEHDATAIWGDCGGHDGRLLYVHQADPDSAEWELLGIDSGTSSPELLLNPVVDYGPRLQTFFPFLDGQAFSLGEQVLLTDGTALGTTPLATGVSLVNGRAEAFGDRLIGASDSLWITDPFEPSGALVLIEPDFETRQVWPEIAVLEETERFAFPAWDPVHGYEIWSSDGTAEGTSIIVDGNPGAASLFSPPGLSEWVDIVDRQFLGLGPRAIFQGRSPGAGAELWSSDGSARGTHLLQDIYPGDYSSTPRNFTRLGNRIFFTAESANEGLELWVTDGTPAGTTILKDVAPGNASSVPDDLVVRDGVLYFSAWSPNDGREAWMSDGTTAGTVRITDIAPGPASSSPQRFARAGNKLFFSATDQIHGYELWAIAYPDGSPLFLDGFEIGSALRWTDSEP